MSSSLGSCDMTMTNKSAKYGGNDFVPTRQFNRWWAQRAHPTISGFEFCFTSPERRLDQTRTSGEVGRALFEHVAA